MTNATSANHIFLSYAREDIQDAVRIYRHLRESRLNVWFDRVSLLPGQHWRVAVNDAIRQSKFFVQLLSSNSVEKHGVVQAETRKALDITLDAPPGHTFILPVRLDNCLPLHEALHDLQWVDLFDDWGFGLKKLSEAMTVQSNLESTRPLVPSSAEAMLPEVLRYDGTYQGEGPDPVVFRFFPAGEVTFSDKKTDPQDSYTSLSFMRAKTGTAHVGTYTVQDLMISISADIGGNFSGSIGVDRLSLRGKVLFSKPKNDVYIFQPFK